MIFSHNEIVFITVYFLYNCLTHKSLFTTNWKIDFNAPTRLGYKPKQFLRGTIFENMFNVLHISSNINGKKFFFFTILNICK
jgi:hypothetical protein